MDPASLAVVALIALGGYLWFGGVPTVSSENDEGTDEEGVILSGPPDTSGTLDAEAWAHGQSLGTFTFQGIGGNFYLRQDAAQSFLRLLSAASVDEMRLQVDSAFRFMADQQALWARHQAGGDLVNQAVAQPGYSNHQSGIAIDIAVQSSPISKTYLWLAANAIPFGWTNVGLTFHPPEYWHWEYNPGADLYG